MTLAVPEFKTSLRTRVLYSLTSLGVATPSEAISGIIAFYIVDVKNLPAPWFASFWFFYTIYNAFNNPLLGYLSDRTRSRWGRRLPYVLFGGLLYAVAFALLFTLPFDGRENPVGLLMPAFGYDTLLEVQPSSVELGFRLFLTVPTSVGFLLAIFLLWLYPLHGKRLHEVKDALHTKRGGD